MKKLTLSLLAALLLPRRIQAANDREEIAIANALDGEGVFEIQQPDKLFIPFGEYPHARGLQKFDRQSGEFLAQTFNSLPARVTRLFTPGVPIYRGHPDVPGRPDSDPAAPAMGWVQGVTVENDGVSLGVKWNADGQSAITNAHYRFYSPNWLLRAVRGGIQPVKLLSIGLTNNPRIPVPAIANDDNQPDESMKLTPELLKLLGFAENDTPTDEQIAKAVTAHNDRFTSMVKAGKTIEAALDAEIGDTTGLWEERVQAGLGKLRIAANDATAKAEKLAGEITAANDRATAARTRFIDAQLGGLVESTRILPAARDGLRTELLAIANDADLDTRLADLAKAAPQMKTKAITGSLGKAKGELQAANDDEARRIQRREAIDGEMVAIANDRTKAGMNDTDKYNLAFDRASRKHPTLFTTKATA